VFNSNFFRIMLLQSFLENRKKVLIHKLFFWVKVRLWNCLFDEKVSGCEAVELPPKDMTSQLHWGSMQCMIRKKTNMWVLHVKFPPTLTSIWKKILSFVTLWRFSFSFSFSIGLVLSFELNFVFEDTKKCQLVLKFQSLQKMNYDLVCIFMNMFILITILAPSFVFIVWAT